MKQFSFLLLGAGIGMFLDDVKENAGRPMGLWVLAAGAVLFVLARR